MDDGLLARLDADPEVQRAGRSAVFRRAIEEYLRSRRKAAVTAAYEKAYGSSSGLGAAWNGWAEEGTWPEP
jgi:hypothetical protein